MAFTSTRVALTATTDTQLVSGTFDEVYVTADYPIYVGPAGVTAATGFPLRPGEPLRFVIGAGDVLHGIAAERPALGSASTATAYVLTNGA